jgi:beta-glucosidase
LLGRHHAHDGGVPLLERLGCVQPGDLEIIAQPLDVLALSWHESNRITVPENLPMLLPADRCFGPLNDVNRLLAPLGFVVAPFDDVETNRFGWPIIPEGLADALSSLQLRYDSALPALHIIDNGMGDLAMNEDACDSDRYCTFLGRRIAWLGRAITDGLDVRGYEYWSVLDNWDWKANYARQYARSVSSSESEILPPLPQDWTGPAAQFLLPAPPKPAKRPRSSKQAKRIHLHPA